MFERRQNRSWTGAVLNLFRLIYVQAVYKVRQDDGNAIRGITLAIAQNALMLVAFMLFFIVAGVKTSPVRGDFGVFIMSGIFVFMCHMKALKSIASADSVRSKMNGHTLINSLVLIGGGALSSLYIQSMAFIAIMFVYGVVISPFEIDHWPGFISMILLGWGSGVALGSVFLPLMVWFPKGAQMFLMIYMRLNMVASGKFFLANTIPNMVIMWFLWNPLFHIIDQARGFAFINYSPQKTSIAYPIAITLVLLMTGLLLEFYTKKTVSKSWLAAK